MTKHAMVADDIKRKILTREWEAGEKIPTEYELCKSNNVSRITVRTALDKLEREGILIRRQGLGTFISSNPIRTDSKIFTLAFKSLLDCPERDAFLMTLFKELGRLVEAQGSALMFLNIPQEFSFSEHVRMSGVELSNFSAGTIFVGYTPDFKDIEFLRAGGIVSAVIGKTPDMLAMPSITNDHQQEAEIGVRHMFSHGRRRLALIDGPFDFEPAALRLKGYKRTLAALGLPFDNTLVVETIGWDRKKGRLAASELLKRSNDFDAILSYGDFSTLGVMDTFSAVGVKIPENIPIFMFDYYRAIEGYMPLRMTGSMCDCHVLASIAIDALATLRSGGVYPFPQKRIPFSIHSGKSCGC